jgi:hypothetical protein
MPDLLETALGKCRKRLLKWRQVNPLWSHDDPPDLRHAVGLGGFRTWVSRVGQKPQL